MKTNKLIKYLEENKCVLAKNVRPTKSIMSRAEFLSNPNKEKYVLEGWIFGYPVLLKLKKCYQ